MRSYRTASVRQTLAEINFSLMSYTMAANTVEEALKQALFVTRAEEIAFAFGWKAATDIKESAQHIPQQRKVAIDYRGVRCMWCGLAGGKHRFDCREVS